MRSGKGGVVTKAQILPEPDDYGQEGDRGRGNIFARLYWLEESHLRNSSEPLLADIGKDNLVPGQTRPKGIFSYLLPFAALVILLTERYGKALFLLFLHECRQVDDIAAG